MPSILGNVNCLGAIVTMVLFGGAWFLSRKKRTIYKSLGTQDNVHQLSLDASRTERRRTVRKLMIWAGALSALTWGIILLSGPAKTVMAALQPTPTATFTSTATASPTSTATPLQSPTPVNSSTPTATATLLSTQTPRIIIVVQTVIVPGVTVIPVVITKVVTATSTYTASPTQTPTNTPTNTPTSTPTETPTQ